MIKPVTNYPSTVPAAGAGVLDDRPPNTLGLWAGNPDLLNACGGPHPDDASLDGSSGAFSLRVKCFERRRSKPGAEGKAGDPAVDRRYHTTRPGTSAASSGRCS